MKDQGTVKIKVLDGAGFEYIDTGEFSVGFDLGKSSVAGSAAEGDTAASPQEDTITIGSGSNTGDIITVSIGDESFNYQVTGSEASINDLTAAIATLVGSNASGVTATGSDDDSGTVVLTGLDDGSAFTLSVSSQLRYFHTFTLEGATSRLALDADEVKNFGFDADALAADSTVELVGFEGGEVIPDVLTSSDAALHAVVGNPVQRNEDGDVSANGSVENVTLDASDLTNIDVLSVAAGSSLTLQSPFDNGLPDFNTVYGSLTVNSADLSGSTITTDDSLILDVGDVESLGSIVAKGLIAGEDLSGVAAGYELTAEVATAAADAAEFDFSSTGFATIDVFEVQDNSNTINVSAAEVDAGHEFTIQPSASAGGTVAFAVTNYSNQNLTSLVAELDVSVTTVDGATLDDEALATADSITVVDTASVTAADADTFGDKLSGDAGILSVSGYTNQNLADITTTPSM